MRRCLALLCCLTVFAAINPLPLNAQEPQPVSVEEMEKAWMDFRKLTKEHAALKFLVGEYNVVSHDYADPENPKKETGTSTIKPIMGGRYIRQIYSSTYGGVPFRGEGINGYDKGKGKFFGTWIDNFSTGVLVTEGDYDKQTHILTETGSSVGPMGEMKVKLVTEPVPSPAKFKMTMYTLLPDGTEMKMMDVVYTPK